MSRIALDAMGGDHAPTEIVLGGVDAAAAGVDLVLVGAPDRIGPILSDAGADLPLVEATEVIGMDDDPAHAIRSKKDASVTVAARMVRSGEAAGFVSAGSTGAAMAAATFVIGRIEGVDRPAIASVFPDGTILLDSGANIDCRPEHLVQFAVMGSALATIIHGIDEPHVGLLSIGEEAGKGRDLEKAAHGLLQDAGVRFVGNVEGRDVGTGRANVIVTDGFTGNVVLKAAEGAARLIMATLVEMLGERPDLEDAVSQLGPVLSDVRDRLDPETYGGAHLLGVAGVAVIAHGSSSRRAVANALKMAAEAADGGLPDRVAAGLAG